MEFGTIRTRQAVSAEAVKLALPYRRFDPTGDDAKAMAQMRDDGKSNPEIATATGHSLETIHYRTRVMMSLAMLDRSARLIPRIYQQGVWPWVWVDYLRKAYETDASTESIGRDMTKLFGRPFSKGAIVGKANRLDLPAKHNPEHQRPEPRDENLLRAIARNNKVRK